MLTTVLDIKAFTSDCNPLVSVDTVKVINNCERAALGVAFHYLQKLNLDKSLIYGAICSYAGSCVVFVTLIKL